MKYVILPPQEIPKHETVHHRPKTLGEMKLAFLNANNKKSWADDEVIPDVVVPVSRVFASRKKFVKALREQSQLLDSREHARFRATLHTVPTNFELLMPLMRSQSASLNLMYSKSPLSASEYFSRRVELYSAFIKEDLRTYVTSEEIDSFVALLDRPIFQRKHIFGTRTDFTLRSLPDAET